MKKANKKINFHLEFSHEKLTQIISKTNTLSEKMSNEDYENTPDSEKTQNEEVLKTYSNYIKKYLEHITKSDSQELIATLKFLFTLNKFAWKKIGDEFTEALWNLYDDEGFNIGDSTGHFNFYEYFLNLFFLNSPNLTFIMKKEAIKFNTAEKTVISEINSELFDELKFESISMQKNFLIDMFIIQILSCADIKMFYTNLSAFIVATESNVMKLFKIISLFALSLWQIEKKENFLGSLLYIVGGVLRDHGKSYLKTKGVLEQNLSYHLCPKDQPHENGFFKPVILKSKDANYIELFFLPIMIQFINGIILSIDFKSLDSFWDDYLPIYYRNLECEELDSEDNLPSHIQIFYYLNLFLCDFIFFFLTNFCQYDTDKKTFTNNQFSYFEEFLKFSFSIMFYSCRNITNLFVFSEKKRKFLEVECDKTEYSVKESFNHYGLSLSLYLILNKEYTLCDFIEFKDTKRSLLPLVLSKEYLFSIYQSALLMIVKTENSSEFRFMKNYQKFCCDFLELICERLEAKTVDVNHSLLLFEMIKFDKEKVNIDIYLNCFVKNKEKLLPEILKLTNKSSEISKILKVFNGYNNTIEEEGLLSTLRTLALNASILNEDIQKSLKNLILPENKKKISLLTDELKGLNASEEYTMFIRFKDDIINSLDNLI